MEPGRGYWIYVTEAHTLTVKGRTIDKGIELYEGWNLAGYNSSTRQRVGSAVRGIKESLGVIYSFDTENGQYLGYAPEGQLIDLQFLSPGSGYWIYATKDTNWKLP
jgi:hypothetical protein